MNKAWVFFKNYLLIVVALPALAAVLGAVYVSQEISPLEYRVFTNAWPNLHSRSTVDSIQKAMSDGKITHWENVVLQPAALADAGGLTTEGATDDVTAERVKLQQTIEAGR